MDLHNKTILVTGAAGTGVGVGVCQAVQQAGGRLVLNDVDRAACQDAAARYPGTLSLPGDIADSTQVQVMFERLNTLGVTLDGLVNNAGIGLSCRAHEASEQEFERLHEVDWRGVWLVSRAFTRHLLDQQRPGSIVNISSVHAAATMRGYAIYAGAKSGVEGFTRGLAVELGQHGIRCNAVAPGYVHSEQNRNLIRTWSDDPDAWVRKHTVEQQAIEREIAPIDCGWAVAFLLSNHSRCITGQVLRVDAGATALLYNKGFL